MNDLQVRLAVQEAAIQWVNSMIQENGISPFLIEDALIAALYNLRDNSMSQFLAAIQPAESPQEQEEEIDAGSGD